MTPSADRYVGQHVFGETRLFLVEVDGNDLEIHRRRMMEIQQDVQHRIRILASRT